MNPQALMLFAAGRGTRMGALAAQRPKPLIEVAGKPLIDHALSLTEPVLPLTRVVNLHHKAAMLRAHLAGRGLLLSDETELLLETGGGLRHALPLLGPGPVFTLNADAVWQRQTALAELAATWAPERMDALLLLVPRAAAIGHAGTGDFLLGADGRLTRGPGAVYTGAQIVKTGGLAAIAEPVFSLNRLWDVIGAEGRLYGLIHPGQWCDVGQPQSIALAEAMLAGGHV